jgi:hemerythrin-like domain-containing protein
MEGGMVSETIQHFYSDDRQKLEQLLADFDRVNGQDPAEARRIFAEYREALECHIRWEEEFLFPTYERLVGPKNGLKALRLEHAEARELTSRMQEGLESGDCEVRMEELLLRHSLATHHLKEELVICPVLDAALTRSQRAELLAQIGAVPN